MIKLPDGWEAGVIPCGRGENNETTRKSRKWKGSEMLRMLMGSPFVEFDIRLNGFPLLVVIRIP